MAGIQTSPAVAEVTAPPLLRQPWTELFKALQKPPFVTIFIPSHFEHINYVYQRHVRVTMETIVEEDQDMVEEGMESTSFYPSVLSPASPSFSSSSLTALSTSCCLQIQSTIMVPTPSRVQY
ncbi:hypothetical protein Syun_028266 [Stephania yunnanensis]|uniref:Uncharacterized protein n=1 Tax=Stephania yunnanensis TaxID=152371 RepID=A0AAP0EH15_9MAGN